MQLYLIGMAYPLCDPYLQNRGQVICLQLSTYFLTLYSLQSISIIRHVHSKLSKHQFGFLPNRSTLQQLLVFTQNLFEAKSEVDVVYMDFRKAFDSVSHNGLLNKLYSIGIIGNLWVVARISTPQIPVWQLSITLLHCAFWSSSRKRTGTTLVCYFLLMIFLNMSILPYPLYLQMILAKCLLSIRSTDDVGKLQSDVNGAAVWSLSSVKFVHVRFWVKPFFNLDTTTYTVNGKPIKQLSKGPGYCLFL